MPLYDTRIIIIIKVKDTGASLPPSSPENAPFNSDFEMCIWAESSSGKGVSWPLSFKHQLDRTLVNSDPLLATEAVDNSSLIMWHDIIKERMIIKDCDDDDGQLLNPRKTKATKTIFETTKQMDKYILEHDFMTHYLQTHGDFYVCTGLKRLKPIEYNFQCKCIMYYLCTGLNALPTRRHDCPKCTLIVCVCGATYMCTLS